MDLGAFLTVDLFIDGASGVGTSGEVNSLEAVEAISVADGVVASNVRFLGLVIVSGAEGVGGVEGVPTFSMSKAFSTVFLPAGVLGGLLKVGVVSPVCDERSD